MNEADAEDKCNEIAIISELIPLFKLTGYDGPTLPLGRP